MHKAFEPPPSFDVGSPMVEHMVSDLEHSKYRQLTSDFREMHLYASKAYARVLYFQKALEEIAKMRLDEPCCAEYASDALELLIDFSTSDSGSVPRT